MTTRLLPMETIESLEEAARDRLGEAMTLQAAGKPYWGIYTTGYVLECVLKSAWARVAGASMVESWSSYRDNARTWAFVIGVAPRRNEHDLLFWARLVIREREFVGKPVLSNFGTELIANVLKVALCWNESMRYHAAQNNATEAEVVIATASWILRNQQRLWR